MAPSLPARGRTERLELKVKDPGSYQPGRQVWSPLSGPANAWRCKLAVFPRGDRGDPSNKIPELAAYVSLHPPPDLERREWTCKDVECSISVRNNLNPELSVTRHTTVTFNNTKHAAGWRTGLLKSRFMNTNNGWLNEEGELIIQAEVKRLPTTESLSVDFSSLDFTEALGPVTFHLAEGPPLLFDKRLLVARSEYFREMLCSPWRESRTGEIDLRSDSLATTESVSTLLLFIVSDSYQAQGNEELAFAVRMLADRYRLHKLVDQVDAELHTLLNEGNVLSFLGRLFGTNSVLESTCLEMIEENGATIFEEQQGKLEQLIQENPGLAKKLIMLGFRCKKRAREGAE